VADALLRLLVFDRRSLRAFVPGDHVLHRGLPDWFTRAASADSPPLTSPFRQSEDMAQVRAHRAGRSRAAWLTAGRLCKMTPQSLFSEFARWLPPATTTSSSAPGRRGARWRTGCQP